jgi:hypothetical protein
MGVGGHFAILAIASVIFHRMRREVRDGVSGCESCMRVLGLAGR